MFFSRKIYQPQNIEVKESPICGRGVFAKYDIVKGKLIEKAPVIFLSSDEREMLRFTKLYHYYFLLGTPEGKAAFSFGYASFYNHSANANAFYTFSKRHQTINLYAYKTIAAGTEITINYNGKPNDTSEVYFPNTD